MSALTIGELSKQVGLPTKTIRFYEDISLIAPATRADNGYRLYQDSIVEELKMIKNARDLGLPIAEIKKLLQGCGVDCDHSLQTVQSDVEKFSSTLDQKIAQLTKLKTQLDKLQSKLADCACEPTAHTRGDKYCCNILNQLLDIERGGEAHD